MELGNSTRPALFHGMPGSHRTSSDLDLGDIGVPFGGGYSASEFTSPAQPAFDSFDMSSSMNSSHFGSTVSPNDLLMGHDPFASAPASTAFTNMTTPSVYNESPFTDFEASPMFTGENMCAEADTWPTLFPDAAPAPSAPAPAAATPASAEQSPATESDEFEEPTRRPSQSRKTSGASSSPGSGRLSSVSGVNANRRRAKVLPPIVIKDPTDTVGMKRAKNTLAARKSRARKQERMEDYEKRIRDLEAEKEKLMAERDQWKAIATGAGAQ